MTDDTPLPEELECILITCDGQGKAAKRTAIRQALAAERATALQEAAKAVDAEYWRYRCIAADLGEEMADAQMDVALACGRAIRSLAARDREGE